MSDLAATNCGCGCENEGGCNSIIWLIILLCCCGCGNNGIGGGCDNGNNSCLWLILLLFCLRRQRMRWWMLLAFLFCLQSETGTADAVPVFLAL